MSPAPDQAAIAAEILRQVQAVGPSRSVSPNDIARALAPGEENWRPLLGQVRVVAIRLAREGRIEVLRKGKPVDPEAEIRGVIRLRIAGGAGETP